MTVSVEPSAWSNGGAGVSIYWGVSETALGPMLLAATDKGICRLSFDEDGSALKRRFPNATLLNTCGSIAAMMDGVVVAIEHPELMPPLPIDVGGTSFQQDVWQALRQIPVGETRNYAEIAAAVGKPDAVRAAGAANGANPVAVLIPCHRVIRSDGGLGGYAYGLERKRRLLAWESQHGELFSY